MTIKLGNLMDWRVLDGKSLSFKAPDFEAGKPRRVRLDLNSEFGCNWYVKAGKEERFLAVIPAGLQTIEFTFDGDFDLMPVRPDDCEIQYWTSEAEEYWTEGNGETFAGIYERQPRNEALEWVMFQAAQNDLRRQKAHAAELEALRAEIGAISERQSGVHGGPPAADQEPAGGKRGKGGKPAAAKAAVNDALGQPPNGQTAADPAPEDIGADGSPKGKDAK